MGRRNSPKILQITASGLKNEFPHTLLAWFDRINLMLYGSRSPLNFLTRRRDMKIQRRRPDGSNSRVLLNHSGIGDLVMADKIEEVDIIKLICDTNCLSNTPGHAVPPPAQC